MSKSKLRALKIAVGFAILVAVVGLVLPPFFQTIHWVGFTDLLIEFVVSDAETGEPIPDAIIKMHSEGGLYKERDQGDFRLVTGSDGRAQHLYGRCGCF